MSCEIGLNVRCKCIHVRYGHTYFSAQPITTLLPLINLYMVNQHISALLSVLCSSSLSCKFEKKRSDGVFFLKCAIECLLSSGRSKRVNYHDYIMYMGIKM